MVEIKVCRNEICDSRFSVCSKCARSQWVDAPVVEKSGWEEEFSSQFVRDDGLLDIGKYDTEALKDFIKNVEKEAYERGQGKMVIDWGVKELENARLEGKKEAEVALIAELESENGKKYEFIPHNGLYAI